MKSLKSKPSMYNLLTLRPFSKREPKKDLKKRKKPRRVKERHPQPKLQQHLKLLAFLLNKLSQKLLPKPKNKETKMTASNSYATLRFFDK